MGIHIKVMTFNLRVDNSGDGINSFFHRTDRIAEVIEDESPELIGFQEVTDAMRMWITDNIKGYCFAGCGRERTYHGESMLIAYKKGTFELISLENRWLSPTPEIPGSTFGGDQSRCPRMFTSAYLAADGAKPFYFINTHLDHVGANARRLSAVALFEYIKNHTADGTEFVLTGDFNAEPDTPEIKLFTSDNGMNINDCTSELGGTFHSFGRLADNTIKIDYIFTNATSADAHTVPDSHPDGIYYSDHYAVCSDIILNS